ncbi:hypothetical protein [Desulforhopalus sp. IMCC35007]|uniref:hypothetical protein n=1 Tax=Desulforhopalus sp. IMCC35007 TaxID=2569543 RepID=UPI0010AEC9B5|nr:hypothetical protein [Desulforhopalus sp. IMCC35007]TKB05687.1 hypothetical protein FCL48_23905 [Desulforhopalus sp. IMCC35007]
MAKNYELIPGEKNNWEVAVFLLIDHLFKINSEKPEITFSRTDLHSTTSALYFIKNLLGPLGYVVDKTLNNSISSAVTRTEQKGYLRCLYEECSLTGLGFSRLCVIKGKYEKNNEQPIGKNQLAFQVIKNLDSETRAAVLKYFKEFT